MNKMIKDYKYYCKDKSHRGELHDPTVTSRIQGGCGDTQELFLYIENNIIEDITYQADGCGATHACGAYVCEMVEGKTVQKGMQLSAGQIINDLKEIPEDHHHCAILVMLALYQAIGRYLLTEPENR